MHAFVLNYVYPAGRRLRAAAGTATARSRSRAAQVRAHATAWGRPGSWRTETAFPTRYLSALDGANLNLCVDLPADPGITGAHLRAGDGPKAARAPMELIAGPSGPQARLTIGCRAPWSPEPARPGLVLPHGTVRLKIVLERGTAGNRECDVAMPRAGHTDGPTKACPSRPDLGFALRFIRGPGNRAYLRLVPSKSRAEVTAVLASWSRFRLTGRVYGDVDFPRAPVLNLSDRRQRRRYSVPMTVDGDRFECDIPVKHVTAKGSHVWDFHVPTGDGRRLRLGRWLSDVRDPKKVLKHPERVLVAADGSSAQTQVYYTPAGSLALKTRRLEAGAKQA